MNSTEGLFQGVLMDATQIPILETGEAGEILTMLASFLNLSEVRPGGQKMSLVGKIMGDAVKNMDLQTKIREKYEAKIEQQTTRESWNREWWNNPNGSEQLEEC